MQAFKNSVIIMLSSIFILFFSNVTLANTLPEKTNIDPNHNWTIHFNQELDSTTVNFRNITVTKPYKIKNSDGTEEIIQSGVPITIELGSDKKSIIVKSPNGGYMNGQKYTLHINDSVRSASNKKLNHSTEMSFTIAEHPAIQSSKTLYEALYNILSNGVTDKVNLSKYTDDKDTITETFNQILADYAELDYIGGYSYYSDGVQYGYRLSPEESKKRNEKIKQTSKQVLNQIITDKMSEFEKVKAVHDYIVLNTAYDYENFLNNTIPRTSYQIDGVLFHGTAVCEGYARTMQYLLTQLDIETKYVTGFGIEVAHAWNKVKIDGEWYNVDSTWNDPVPDVNERVLYNYFLLTDEQLALDHIWDNSNLPQATSTRFSLFHHLDIMISNGDYYYIQNILDENFYTIRKDGTEQALIGTFIPKNIVFYKDWLYFTLHSYSNPMLDGGRLYKVKNDGSDLTQLSSVTARNLKLDGNTLTYTLGIDSTIHLLQLD